MFSYKKWVIFPDPYTYRKIKVEVELDMSSYATKSDLKTTTGADTSDFAKKADLYSLK